MQTPASSNSRKRQHSDQCPFELEGEAWQTVPKKRKAVHIPDPQQPLTHQDNSSAIPLERHALRRLRRSNTEAARASHADQSIRRPATRLAVAEWKRQHQPLEPAGTYLKNCGHEQYKALQSFSKHGGPDLRDLRGCQRAAHCMNTPMDSSHANSTSRSRSRRTTRTNPTTEGNSSKNLSPYDRSFQQFLVDSHVFPPYYESPDGCVAPQPGNWDYINERLAQPRSSLSPSKFSKEQHKAFVRLDASAAKESQVKKDVIPIIEGTIKDPRTASGEIPFTNLASLVEDENLVSGKPDFYHGARPEQLERRVRDELGRFVIPSTQHDLPIVPNHFTAAKGPDGSAAVAGRQATYDAYFGARAIRALQTYGQAEPKSDGNAYTFSSIYHSGLLKLYTSHPAQPANPGGRPDYHMNHLRSFAMGDTADTWRSGATWYRNSMDLAKEMRDEAIRGANDVINRVPMTPFDSNTGTSFASTGTHLELDSLTMESQVEAAQTVSSEDFQTAASSQDEEEEDEPRRSLLYPAKRSSRFQKKMISRRRRRDREESKGTGSTPLSSQEAIPQASFSAAKKGKGRGKKPIR